MLRYSSFPKSIPITKLLFCWANLVPEWKTETELAWAACSGWGWREWRDKGWDLFCFLLFLENKVYLRLHSLLFYYAAFAAHCSHWLLKSFPLSCKEMFYFWNSWDSFSIWFDFFSSKIVSLYDLKDFPHVLFPCYSQNDLPERQIWCHLHSSMTSLCLQDEARALVWMVHRPLHDLTPACVANCIVPISFISLSAPFVLCTLSSRLCPKFQEDYTACNFWICSIVAPQDRCSCYCLFRTSLPSANSCLFFRFLLDDYSLQWLCLLPPSLILWCSPVLGARVAPNHCNIPCVGLSHLLNCKLFKNKT